MIDDISPTRSRIADRIIRSRGEIPSGGRLDGGNDERRYQAAIISDGFPHMGFSLFCKDGSRHGFMYHNLENLDLKEGDYGSYLKLTHRGKAVTLRGAHLHEMFQGIMEHTLQAVYEFDPSAYPDLSEGEPVVDWVIIGDINTEAEGKEQGPPATT